MKLRQILRSKQGVALENAILFMLIIFSFCTLLTSLTLIGHHQVKFEKMTLQQDVEIDQIGEDFLTYLTDSEQSFQEISGYVYEVSNNTLTVKRETDGEVMLYVEVEKNGDQLNVVKWRYSLPDVE